MLSFLLSDRLLVLAISEVLVESRRTNWFIGGLVSNCSNCCPIVIKVTVDFVKGFLCFSKENNSL